MKDRKRTAEALVEQQDALVEYLESLLTEVGFARDEFQPGFISEGEVGNTDALLERPVGHQKTAESIDDDDAQAADELPGLEVLEEDEEDEEEEEYEEGEQEAAYAQTAFEEDIGSILTDGGDDSGASVEQSTPVKEEGLDRERVEVLEALLLEATEEGQGPPEGKLEFSPPDWGKERFQSLTFDLAGLTLAAPLDRLNGILEWGGLVTKLPGYKAWFIGIVRNRGHNVAVIDLAQIVMPGKLEEMPLKERSKFLILIGDGQWGIVSSGISTVVALEPDDIKWKRSKGGRRWLAGTVIEHMCALLDVDELIKAIERDFDGA